MNRPEAGNPDAQGAEPWKELEALLRARGVEIPPGAMALLRKHWELVRAEGGRQNLTSIESDQDAAVTHYLDSLALLWAQGQLGLELPDGPLEALDAGSGAGFPGIPLKIFRPQWRMVLADARLKRVRFLESAIRALGLSGCAAVHARIERAGTGMEGRFDLVVARAVSGPAAAVRMLSRAPRRGGHIILYTSSPSEKERALLRREAQKRGLEFSGEARADIPGKAGHWLLCMCREHE